MSKIRFAAPVALSICALFALLAAIPAQRLSAQSDADATAVQQTLEASVNALFTQTAQAAAPTPNFTQTVEALFSGALTATAAAQPVEPPVTIDVAALDVVSTREFDLFSGPARTSSYLAPDGERFAHFDGEQICIYGTNGELPACTPWPDRFPYYPGSPRWSPDGRYLAFIDNQPLRYLRDSDLWLLDTQAGTLVNLTDDGTNRFPLDLRPLEAGEKYGLTDLAPRFSADSQRVYFVRYELLFEVLVASLFSVSVEGGEAVFEHVLTPDARANGFATLLDLGPNDEFAVFNLQTPREDGLYRLDMTNGDIDLVYRLDPERERFAMTLDLSPAGDAVLFQDISLQIGFGEGRALTPWHIVSLDGQTRPAALPPGEDAVVLGAGWSPDGAGLVYLVRSSRMPELAGLYVGAPGEAGRLLLPGPQEVGQYFAPPTSFYDRLDWGANGVVLITLVGGPPTTAVYLGLAE